MFLLEDILFFIFHTIMPFVEEHIEEHAVFYPCIATMEFVLLNYKNWEARLLFGEKY